MNRSVNAFLKASVAVLVLTVAALVIVFTYMLLAMIRNAL